MRHRKHLHSYKILLYILAASFCTRTIVSGQSRLSGKFTNTTSRVSDHVVICSVSYKDSLGFKTKYKDKIIIQNNYIKTATIKSFYNFIITDVAIDSNIVFIDIMQKPRVEAGIDFANSAFNRITKAHHYFPTLQGLHKTISIKEQLFDTTNIDLRNRSFKTPLTPTQTSQHATTMATFIAGAGNSSAKTIGVAPASRFTSSDFSNLLPDDQAIFSTYDIHLQNHSYGVSIENYYGNEAAAYDQQIFLHPTQVHVFSIGNMGHAMPTEGTYKNLNFANLSGNFKQAKNVITVTAVDTTLLVNSLNSRGPAYDGRLKPEITAYGQSGTSDAAALVTGSCALLQEKYEQANGELPAASMIKAILIASATDIGPEGIDYTYGYGSLNTYKATQLTNLGYTAKLEFSSYEEKTISIPVPASTAELKVAVAWNDPPAIQNAAQALVNDFDASISFGGNQYLPWVLTTKPDIDSLKALPKRRKDHLNTVEYFTIQTPNEGLYQLTLKAPLLTTTQEISIAYWFEKKDNFEWDYPTASDVVEANSRVTLFWDQTINQPGELSYQLNNGDWRVVRSGLDLTHYFHWQVPDTLSSARLRIRSGNGEYISDKFIISPQPNLTVAFVCDNNFSLTWPSIPNADSYRLYTMGEKYLDKVLDTTDTSIVLTKNSKGLYFAIAPVRKDSIGLKSETIDFTTQGSFCYLNLFDAERYNNDRVKIQIDLSTFINVDHIIVYKTINNNQKNIFTQTSSPKTLKLEWFDTDIIGGVMTYQAEIFLADGTRITSEVHEVFIELKDKAILFPNPVPNNSDLTILSDGQGLRMRILNAIGEFILTRDIEFTLETLNIETLTPGIYFYQLQRNGSVIDKGKFIKQ